MGAENPHFDYDAARAEYAGMPEFQLLQQMTPDALEMATSEIAARHLNADRLTEYWDTIGKGMGGFYDDIRENGCASCGSSTPGCCDACS